ncbi:hypothetical protein BN1080_00649 [Planococcus massiliensis]|uniref:Uncharacterized protein n=1 Tax=Planococcus massiliensis TaxID=1499687 RepID=A0A098EHF2_9BACL|nr:MULTISPECIES: hypothetical protein [Planococcus]MCJ1907985.1 hypothetical protein [Planococcus ruber]CEG21734.1 hypothetical protein BN1080_00649 [Planococcus massiliensis]
MDVYIIFTDTKTPLSKMIKAYTRHPYSHVSLAFSSDLTEVYSFGRKNADNAFNGGFVKEDMHNHLFQRAHCAIFKCPVDAKGLKAMKNFVFAMEQERDRYKYNVAGLFGVVVKRGFGGENSFFCSQFVAEVLRQGRIEISQKPSRLMMPRDIFCADFLQLAYSGPLSSYPPLVSEQPCKMENTMLMEAL